MKTRTGKTEISPTPLGSLRPDTPPDQQVLLRRPMHIASARWLAKWSYPLQFTFAVISFVVVLLPLLSTHWKEIIEEIPFLAWIFNDFSRFGPISLFLLFIIVMPFLILNCMVKHYPGDWDPTKQGGFPNPKQVVEMSLYPNTLKEEFVYWTSQFLGTVGTSLWMYLPFGVLAYCIR